MIGWDNLIQTEFVKKMFAVPLCAGHHRELQNYGDGSKWWEKCRIDPVDVARDLWETTRNRKSAHIIQ